MRFAHAALWTHDLDGRRNSNAERFRCFDRRGYPAKARVPTAMLRPSLPRGSCTPAIPPVPAVRRTVTIRPFETIAIRSAMTAVDPFLPFKFGRINGREEPESGLPLKS